MAQAALIATAVSSVASGVAAYQQGQAQREHANINSHISRTRAIQSATTKAEQTNAELASMRAALAANSQGVDGGSKPLMDELLRVRSREGRIEAGNFRQEGADWRRRGKNAMAQGRMAFISKSLGAAQPLYDLSQL